MIDFARISKEIANSRQDVVGQLIKFSLTDVILFWSTEADLKNLQNEKWYPILHWLNERFSLTYQKTESFTPPKNENNLAQLKQVLNAMSLPQFTAYYLASVRLKSPLLALSLVEGKITASDAFELSCLEELYQSKSWGVDAEAEQCRQSTKDELIQIEEYIQNNAKMSVN